MNSSSRHLLAVLAADIAKVLFFIFLAICVVLFILGLMLYKSVT